MLLIVELTILEQEQEQEQEHEEQKREITACAPKDTAPNPSHDREGRP